MAVTKADTTDDVKAGITADVKAVKAGLKDMKAGSVKAGITADVKAGLKDMKAGSVTAGIKGLNDLNSDLVRSKIAHVDAAPLRRYSFDAKSTLFVADTSTTPEPLSFTSSVINTPEHWSDKLRRAEEQATGERGRAEAKERAVLLTFQSGQAMWQCNGVVFGDRDVLTAGDCVAQALSLPNLRVAMARPKSSRHPELGYATTEPRTPRELRMDPAYDGIKGQDIALVSFDARHPWLGAATVQPPRTGGAEFDSAAWMHTLFSGNDQVLESTSKQVLLGISGSCSFFQGPDAGHSGGGVYRYDGSIIGVMTAAEVPRWL